MRRERGHPDAKLRRWDFDGWRHHDVLAIDTQADIVRLKVRHSGTNLTVRYAV